MTTGLATALAAIMSLAAAWADEPKNSTDAPAPVPTPAAIPDSAKEIVFSFSEASWEEVARWLAEISGRSLLIESRPAGTFNYFDKRAYSFTDALDIINSVLLTKGHALILKDNFLILADLKEGIPPHRVDRVKPEDLPKRARTELVSVLLTLRGLIAEEAKKEFESLTSPYGKVLALPSTNQILIADTAQNAQQIVALIKELEGEEGKADLRAFPLKNVSARDIERVVRDLLGLPPREVEASRAQAPQPQQNNGEGDGRDRFRQMLMQQFMGGGGGGRGDQRGGGQGGPQQSGQRGNATGPFVSVDERTNTLFVAATPDKLSLVATVIERLDVPSEGGSTAEQTTPRIEVYSVTAGDAEGLAGVLQSVFNTSADLKVTSHPDGRALIVYATPRDHERLKAVLAQIKSEGLRVEVIPLRVLDASNTAELILSLLQTEEEDATRTRFSFFDRQQNETKKSGPSIEPDAERNRLVVRGTESQIREVRLLLVKLGETGLSDEGLAQGGRYRVVPLNGQDPKGLAESLERLWNRLDTKTPIRVEVLGDKADTPDSNGPTQPPASEPSKDDQSEWERRTRRSNILPVGYQENEVPPTAETNPQEVGDDASKPITIVVGPDNIALFSEDLKSLDMFENLLNSVLRGETTSGFAYYYLKSADAQETAYLLDQALYGETRTPSFFFPEEEKPNRARILPDTRSNALLVVGPPAEQRKIEQLLEIIDRDDRPESDADAKPYVIPVIYGSAEEIAQTIKDVFATQLFDSRGARGNIPNINALGGGRNTSTNQPAQKQAKLTVGVDEKTNSVVVSAPADIRMEVEKLVKTLDDVARTQGRSAKVLTLKNTTPEAVEQALGNLFGVRTTEELRAERQARARAQAEADQDRRAERRGNTNNNNNRQQRDINDLIRNLPQGGGRGGGDFRPPRFFNND